MRPCSVCSLVSRCTTAIIAASDTGTHTVYLKFCCITVVLLVYLSMDLMFVLSRLSEKCHWRRVFVGTRHGWTCAWSHMGPFWTMSWWTCWLAPTWKCCCTAWLAGRSKDWTPLMGNRCTLRIITSYQSTKAMLYSVLFPGLHSSRKSHALSGLWRNWKRGKL